MKQYKIRRSFIIFLLIFIIISSGPVWIIKKNQSYQSRISSTKTNLLFSRQSISLFYELNDRFPNSLHELDGYAREFPDKIKRYFLPGEGISSRYSSRSEHQILDNTGGLFYDPNTGELKINLTKPLKSYWPFYFGQRRNEVPAGW